MHNTIQDKETRLFLYWDKRKDKTPQEFYGSIGIQPNHEFVYESFDPAWLTAQNNVVLLMPIGHYVIGKERCLALFKFQSDPSNRVIFV
jgi:hypothetical protein